MVRTILESSLVNYTTLPVSRRNLNTFRQNYSRANSAEYRLMIGVDGDFKHFSFISIIKDYAWKSHILYFLLQKHLQEYDTLVFLCSKNSKRFRTKKKREKIIESAYFCEIAFTRGSCSEHTSLYCEKTFKKKVQLTRDFSKKWCQRMHLAGREITCTAPGGDCNSVLGSPSVSL